MTGDLVLSAQLSAAIGKAVRFVSKTSDRFRQSIIENPLAWFLAALLVVAYESHQRGRNLDRVCELFGLHDASYGHPTTARTEIDTICSSWRRTTVTTLGTQTTNHDGTMVLGADNVVVVVGYF